MNQEFEFNEEQVPYDLLGQYGLTREMIEDLPEAPYRDIMNGLLSPVLPVSVRDEAGNTISARTRIRLVGTDDGKVDVLFYPRLLRCELDSYSEAEQYELRQGRVILSHAPDDPERKCFVQIDPDTNQVMYVPTPVIGRNIRNLMDRFELSTDDITLIQMGEAAVVGTGKDVLAIGVDLSERTVEQGQGLGHGQVQFRHLRMLGQGCQWRPLLCPRGGIQRRDHRRAAETYRPQRGEP